VNVSPVWITDDDALGALLTEVGPGPLAFDLEADSFHHYRDQVCLVQLSFGDHHVLVDPLAGVDLRGLAPVLADASIPKLLHGSDYDLRLLQRDFDLEIRGLFDTMVAARLGGETAFGLAALLGRHLGVELDKRFLGRLTWAQEEFRRLEQVRWTRETNDEDAFRRVKGSARMDRRALAVVRELYRYRDDRARDRDVPPFRVFPDEALVAMVERMPTSIDALASIPRLPRRYREGGSASQLLAVLYAGRNAPPVAASPRRGERRRVSTAAEAIATRLRVGKDAEADRLGLERSVLGTRKTIDAIAECLVENRSWREVEGLRRWQAEILAPLVDSSN
jgi:ribonuclease D